MKKYNLDFGIVILCPERNIGGLKNTVGSINHHSLGRDYICTVGDDVSAKELKEMKELCPTHKGVNTITSLVNVGINKLKHEWAFIVFSGSRVRPYIERKFETFATSEKDILYPVVDRKMNFVDGSFNGVLINRKTFQEVGDFPTGALQKEGVNEFEMAKMLWAIDALEHGCVFKGIIGMRII